MKPVNAGIKAMRETIRASMARDKARRAPRGSAPDIEAALEEFRAKGRKIKALPPGSADGLLDLEDVDVRRLLA